MSTTKAQIQRHAFRPSAVRTVRYAPGRNSDSETIAHHSPVLFKQKGEFDDIRNSPRVAAQRQQLKGAFGQGAGSREKNGRAGGLVRETSRSALTSRARLTDRPKVMSYRGLAPMPDNSPQAQQPAQLYENVRLDRNSQSENVVQREQINGTEVVLEGGYPCFSYDGKKYHIDETEPKHVTCDSEGRTHYYFEGDGEDIVGNVGPGRKKKGGETKKFKFEQLPSGVQRFIKGNYHAIVTVKTKGSISV